jgi:hypothetical protein
MVDQEAAFAAEGTTAFRPVAQFNKFHMLDQLKPFPGGPK